MSHRSRAVVVLVGLLLSGAVRSVADDDQIPLALAEGRPLRFRLNEKITLERVGQIVAVTVIDPVYAYDRVVIPPGTKVTGHIARFDSSSRWSRARRMLAGDFTPQKAPLVVFDTLTLTDGTHMSIANAAPIERAPDDKPAPQSILTARLVTPLDSASTAKGAAVQAVLTEPIFSADHRLIYAKGTTLDGEVTFSKHAASWHRNGQLRFLIESADAAEGNSQKLLASLYAVESSQDDRIAVDDEGGTSATNSNTRFIAPALAILSLHSEIDQHHRRFDNDGDDNETVSGQPEVGGRNLPVSIALGVMGGVRTPYQNVVSKGHEVVFPANTLIQLQLAPGATSDRQ